MEASLKEMKCFFIIWIMGGKDLAVKGKPSQKKPSKKLAIIRELSV